MPVETSKNLYTTALDNHVTLQRRLGYQAVWTEGNFNARGVAPGPSAPQGSRRGIAISKWLKEELTACNLTALWSEATHKAEGALGIHITQANEERVPTLAWRDYSDHAFTLMHGAL